MSKEEKEEEAEEEAKPVRAAVTPVIKRREAKAARPVWRVAEPVKEMPKKPSPKTVKGKIAAIQKATGKIYSGARAIQSDANRVQSDIKGKTEVFRKAVADIHSSVRVLESAIGDHMKKHQDAVSAMQSAINEQTKENLEAVAAMQSGINKLQSDTNEQMRENQAYVRDFYE